MRFSIITPVHLWNRERIKYFKKTIKSIKNQTFKDFEWIIVDDGSTQHFDWEEVDQIAKVIHKQHEERVISMNSALEESKGEWLCFLDSDDEYKPEYLEEVNKMIEENPEFEMFNFGCEYHHKDGDIKKRDPFEPKVLDIGHEKFGGGNIVNGTFVFSRKVYEDLGAFPPKIIKNADCTEINYGGVRDLLMWTPYDFAAYAQLEFPEMREYFMVDHEAEPNKIIKELGNPWGNDYYLFYKYTRQYHSKPIKKHLYIVHPR